LILIQRSGRVNKNCNPSRSKMLRTGRDGLLDYLVFQRHDSERPLFTIGLRNVGSPGWLRAISAAMDPIVKVAQLRVPNGQTAPYRAAGLDPARAELLSSFFRTYVSA
jgi:hypothetical protein